MVSVPQPSSNLCNVEPRQEWWANHGWPQNPGCEKEKWKKDDPSPQRTTTHTRCTHTCCGQVPTCLLGKVNFIVFSPRAVQSRCICSTGGTGPNSIQGWMEGYKWNLSFLYILGFFVAYLSFPYWVFDIICALDFSSWLIFTWPLFLFLLVHLLSSFFVPSFLSFFFWELN